MFGKEGGVIMQDKEYVFEKDTHVPNPIFPTEEEYNHNRIVFFHSVKIASKQIMLNEKYEIFQHITSNFLPPHPIFENFIGKRE